MEKWNVLSALFQSHKLITIVLFFPVLLLFYDYWEPLCPYCYPHFAYITNVTLLIFSSTTFEAKEIKSKKRETFLLNKYITCELLLSNAAQLVWIVTEKQKTEQQTGQNVQHFLFFFFYSLGDLCMSVSFVVFNILVFFSATAPHTTILNSNSKS